MNTANILSPDNLNLLWFVGFCLMLGLAWKVAIPLLRMFFVGLFVLLFLVPLFGPLIQGIFR